MSLEGKPWHAPTSVVATNPPLGLCRFRVWLKTRDMATLEWTKKEVDPIDAHSWAIAREQCALREQVEYERLEVVMVWEETP